MECASCVCAKPFPALALFVPTGACMHAALFLSLIAENKTVIRGKNVYFIARSAFSALQQIDDMKNKKDNSCLRKQVRAQEIWCLRWQK